MNGTQTSAPTQMNNEIKSNKMILSVDKYLSDELFCRYIPGATWLWLLAARSGTSSIYVDNVSIASKGDQINRVSRCIFKLKYFESVFIILVATYTATPNHDPSCVILEWCWGGGERWLVLQQLFTNILQEEILKEAHGSLWGEQHTSGGRGDFSKTERIFLFRMWQQLQEAKDPEPPPEDGPWHQPWGRGQTTRGCWQ